MLRMYTVHGHALVPVSIEVEAESQDDAKLKARAASSYDWDIDGTHIEEVDCIDDVEEPLCSTSYCYSYAQPDSMCCEEHQTSSVEAVEHE